MVKPLKVYLGGEAEVRIYQDKVEKIRKPKRYRVKQLDKMLRSKRTKIEAKIMSLARKNGVATPIILDVDKDKIVMEKIDGEAVKYIMNEEISKKIGESVAKLHTKNIIHGDITPMNMILYDNKIYFVDFGLAFIDNKVEPKGVDLHVYFESLKAYFDNWQELKKSFIDGYISSGGLKEVVKRAEEIEIRGRYIERRLQS
ncbi:Kae1-associated kinase Bud32 [Archaeoglobales archaeon]|nr:MAG: Kae1-associated kinase Bud32 [Archaeoglobales archaeon]